MVSLAPEDLREELIKRASASRSSPGALPAGGPEDS
jgi:hypothetical protein